MRTLQILLLVLFTAVAVDAQTVYITKTGAKYHRGSCRYLSRSKIPISLEEAKNKGYGACSVCKPPTTVMQTSSTGQAAVSSTKTAFITTIIDGNDIGKIKLWDHRTERDKVVTYCENNHKVTILEDDGTYVKCKTAAGKVGWCMKGFIRQDK